MRLSESYNNIYFALNFNPYGPDWDGWSSHEDGQKMGSEIERIVRSDFPKLQMGRYHYGGGAPGFNIQGTTDHRYFRELFGDNVRRGFSFEAVPFFPITPFISDIYFKWYQTGELKVPKPLAGLVESVCLPNVARGSFQEWNLWVPKNALKK